LSWQENPVDVFSHLLGSVMFFTRCDRAGN
jgi:hypothetical protein